jgi:hypothetical protein
MTVATPTRFRLENHGQIFEVETASAGLSTVARLFVEGVQVDEKRSSDHRLILEGGGLTVVVRLNWLDHVMIAIGQVLIGVLGIGALLQALLPRIDWPTIPLPDLPAIPWPDLPDIPWPDVPWPNINLPDLTFLEPIKELWSSVNWLVPIVIAVIVAINEVRKRRKREQAAAVRRQTESVSRKVVSRESSVRASKH